MISDNEGQTVLHAAAKSMDSDSILDLYEGRKDSLLVELGEVVRALVRSNADLTTVNGYGETPLQSAMICQNTIAVTVLLEIAAEGRQFTADDRKVLDVIRRRPTRMTIEDVVSRVWNKMELFSFKGDCSVYLKEVDGLSKIIFPDLDDDSGSDYD